MDVTPTFPDSLPLLARGRHSGPAHGACFMELASMLAGERFSDGPRCSDPVLAAFARGVNDALDDECRQRLLPLVPDVVGTAGRDPRIGVAVVVTATTAALAVAPEDRRLRRVHSRARRRLADLGGAGGWTVRRYAQLSQPAFLSHVAPVGLSLAVDRLAAAGPDVLVEALRDCLAAVRNGPWRAGAAEPPVKVRA